MSLHRKTEGLCPHKPHRERCRVGGNEVHRNREPINPEIILGNPVKGQAHHAQRLQEGSEIPTTPSAMSNDKIDIHATYTEIKPATELVPGAILNGKFELLERIGHGGMGIVWKAKDRIADRLVALKFVLSDMRRFETEMERMRESFGKVHALHHQTICPLYSLEDGLHLGYYLVMKYLEGETLADYVKRKDLQRDGMPLDQVIAFLKPVAQALDYAHGNGVIHRDIKPSNIFIEKTKRGREIRLIDFGLADAITQGLDKDGQNKTQASGTRPYMAPEQWLGQQESASTDQYALAVTAYQLLAGCLPFTSSDPKLLRSAIILKRLDRSARFRTIPMPYCEKH